MIPKDTDDRTVTIEERDGACLITVPNEQWINGGNTIECIPDRIEIEPEACVAFLYGHKWNRSGNTVSSFSTIDTRRCRLCGLSQVKSTEWENME